MSHEPSANLTNCRACRNTPGQFYRTKHTKDTKDAGNLKRYFRCAHCVRCASLLVAKGNVDIARGLHQLAVRRDKL